jgi:hypothetical protein
MNKNEPLAVRRRVGPIPFYDNDGNPLHGLDFKTALGHVFVCSETTDYTAATADVVTRTNSYYFEFALPELNADAFVGVKLTRPGTTGNTTATAANSATNSGAGMTANQYKGQWFVDSAGSRYLISSHTATVFTLAASGATPAAGAYVVESYRDVEWAEPITQPTATSWSSTLFAALGVTLLAGETVGTPTFSRTAFQIAAASSPSTVDDFYTGGIAVIYDDTTATRIGQSATIDSYDGGTKILTLAGTGFAVAPSSTSKIAIHNAANVPTGDYVRAVFDGETKLEGSYTPGDLIRLIASILGGKVGDFRSGTLVFRNLNDTKTRWTVVTDPSGRITITPGDLT